MKIDVSIIIPVYNSQNYIERCLKSIIEQTYKNFEVIIIDDGSTDNSSNICNKYCKKDLRFKYFYKKNGGVSSARNYGLKVSKGIFISFIDSDDYLEKDFLKILINNINLDSKIDMSICGYRRVYENKVKDMFCRKFWGKNDVCTSICCVLDSSIFASCVWNKLFKSSIIKKNKLKFDSKYLIGEDLKFCIDYLCYCSNTFYTEKVLYNYLINSSSLMRQNKKSSEFNSKWITEWNSIIYCEKLYYSKFKIEKKVEKSFIEKKLNVSLKLLYLMGKKSYNTDQCTKDLIKFIRNNFLNMLISKKVSINRKFKGMLAYLKYSLGGYK